MTAAASSTYPPLTIAVLPAREACDYEYFRHRLADVSVLEQSVAIRIFRMPLLAVPVGGPRRGGYFSTTSLTVGLAVRGLLQGRPGFTSPRLRWSPYRDACHIVEWGETPPRHWDDVALGRFYGYSDTVIAAFAAPRCCRRSPRPHDPLFGVPEPFPRSFVERRRGPQLPIEREHPKGRAHMCRRHPPCPAAEASDREAATVVGCHDDQGWALLGNGHGDPATGLQNVEPKPLPRRTPREAARKLDEEHAPRMEERPPDFFHDAGAPQKWQHLHRVLTREEPET
jgi:hypothetical protein